MRASIALKDSHGERLLFRQRLMISLVAVAIFFIIVVYRYGSLQIVHYEDYRTQSDRNRVHVQPIAPKRGLIYDRNGFLVADNRPSYTLSLVKERIPDIDATLADLQQLFDIDERRIEKFDQRLGRRKPYQSVPLKYQLTEDEISRFAVNRYRLPGVEIEAQLVRHYPGGDVFTHISGYVGRINVSEQEELDKVNYAATDHIGKSGIEKRYENELHGIVGSQYVETNARGRVLRVLNSVSPQPGKDLVLHVDSELQRRVQQSMGARRGAVVAINPQDGGILAMVSTPSYDPNPFVTGIGVEQYAALRDSIDLPLFNRALQGQYPPGSTVKPVFGLAGLHYGVVHKRSRVADPGWYQLPNDDRLYRDWKREGHADRINLYQSIVQSCDVFFYDMAYKLGIDRIHEFSRQFGFGNVTNVDSTSERSGLLPSREWKRENKRERWFPGETLNVGIGQGYMLTTPLQLAVVAATLANRGKRPTPQLVKQVGDLVVEPRFESFGLDSDDWDYVLDSMEDVVHATRGTAASISEGAWYRMAGKTGTAQVISIAQDGEYDHETLLERQRDHALFIGFAPAENPVIAVAIVVENAGGGGSVAAPLAREIFDWAMRDTEKSAAASGGET